MPYIPREQRAAALAEPAGVGELTYALTQVCVDYLGRHMTSYRRYAEVRSALACTQEEIYRVHVAPYEDIKREANGDVVAP